MAATLQPNNPSAPALTTNTHHEQRTGASPAPSFAQPQQLTPKPKSVIQPLVSQTLSNPKNTPRQPAINYRNGRKQEPMLFNFNNYYNHREKLPQHYHPLVQYLENTEVKYHNDNLFENSPIGFPTKAQ